jgi:phage FluMu gp28-like protein
MKIPKRYNFDPMKCLLPYQREWALDKARWKFGLMSRQVGKDFSCAFEGVRDIMGAEAQGQKREWLIVAPSERQSLESLEKWKAWAVVLKNGLNGCEEVLHAGRESLLKSAMITFAGGSRVMAVPGLPHTVRGFSANIVLTEFAFFEDPAATWRAILPSVTNSLRGGVKKVRLITTPNGLSNKAHDLWVRNYRPGVPRDPKPDPASTAWSCHFVDIHSAVAQGLKVDIDQLREALDDPEGWAQEFECQFTDTQSTLLPYELIATCESAEATAAVSPEYWLRAVQGAQPHVMGIDFGRRRDLTVAWSHALAGDVARTVEVLELENTSTPEQVELLRPRLRHARRVCLDYTGPGIGLGDYLASEYGEWNPSQHKFGKIELCAFTPVLKVEIFSKLRMAFEKRTVRVPVSRLIREDLHSVNRVSGTSGQITYRAPHNADGHADRCTALALSLRAAANAPVTGAPGWSPPSLRANPGPSRTARETWP